MEAIDTLYFGTVGDFCEDILDEYDELPESDKSITVLAPYSDVVEMLKEFILCDFKVAKIAIKTPDFDGADEYYLDLLNGELWVYPAKDEDGAYYDNDAYIGYIHGDANFKAIQAYCEAWSVREYAIDELDEGYATIPDDDDYDRCYDCAEKYECEDSSFRNADVEIKEDKTEDGMKGFTATKSSDNGYLSYSFYSTDDDYVDDMHEFVKKLFGH